MPASSAETNKKMQELQLAEHQAQQLAIQKQTTQVEFNEIQNALAEIAATTEEVYRVLGSVMVATEKSTLTKELSEREKVLELRIRALEKQEKIVDDKAKKLREELLSQVSQPRKK